MRRMLFSESFCMKKTREHPDRLTQRALSRHLKKTEKAYGYELTRQKNDHVVQSITYKVMI